MPRRRPYRLICLGVGDGHVSAHRAHAAFLYEFGATRLLVDCGEPATQSLLRAGTRLEALDGVVISHLHFDHVGGVFTLLQGLWLSRRQRPLTLHLPQAGVEPVQALLRAAHLFNLTPPPFALRLEPLRSGQPFKVGAITVTPLANSHLASPPPARRRGTRGRVDEAFSFLLEDGRRRVAHSADLGAVEDVAALVAEPLDLLVCELAHLDPPALLARLRGQPIRRTLLVHLSAAQWRARRRWLARAARTLAPGAVGIPRDGERVTF